MKRVALLILTIVSVVLFSVSCNNNPGKAQLEFYYYPEKNVYFDVAQKNFLYSIDGGKTRVSISSAGQKPPPTLGKSVEVYSDSTDVFRDNEAHRKLYAGVLYNLVRGDTTTAPAKQEVTERKLPQKSPVAIPTKQNDKPKKGLGKLFDKIFGKKDKK